MTKRLLCVDALRGFDMLWIIGGGDVMISLAKGYPSPFTRALASHFDHQWGQFHFYDIIMPLFLFIVGIVMPVAFARRLEKGDTKKKLYAHVIRRVIILYVLGVVTAGHLFDFDFSTLRLWAGTLHAIAAGYLVSAVLILELSTRWQVLVTACLLLLYWVIMAFVPIPGHMAGIYEEHLNLALYIDNKILGRYQEGFGWTYILTNLTFVCSVMLGVFAGRILISAKSNRQKILELIFAGIGCLFAGIIWSHWFPIIHHLWTSSLVLFAGGWSFLILTAFFTVIDVWGFKRWTFPFVVIGANAIAVYVATQLFDFKQVAAVFVKGIDARSGNWDQFILSLSALIVIWLILYWMYRTKTFIKI